MLKRRGYEVEIAMGGREALEKARQNPPDLFLVDVLMPDLNGYHVTEAVRQDPKLKHLPVILFSAATRAEYKTHGFEVGADDYLTKPILNDALDGRIRAAIQLAEKRRLEAEAIPLPPIPDLPHKEPGRVIGFWGCKGGVGLTTLTINVGAAFAKGGQSQVILCDLNVGMGSMVLYMGLQAAAIPRSPWTTPSAELNPELVREALVSYSQQISVLLFPEGEPWAPTMPSVKAVLDQLRDLADYVLLDIGAGVTPDKHPLLHACDHVVLVAGADRVASVLTEYELEVLSELDIDRGQVSVVMIQRRDSTGSLTPQLLETQLRLQLDAVIPIASENGLQAFEQGIPVVDALPGSLLAKSYHRLAEKLNIALDRS